MAPQREANMTTAEGSRDQFYDELAGRFQALGKFFGDVGSRDSAQRVFEGLFSSGGKDFREMADLVNIPGMDGTQKYHWLKDVVGAIYTKVVPVRVCYLRQNLSNEERLQYRMIVLSHLGEEDVSVKQYAPSPFLTPTRPVIPPGPFLNDLEAANLVECVEAVIKETIYRPPD
jgi:hypothetical protein